MLRRRQSADLLWQCAALTPDAVVRDGCSVAGQPRVDNSHQTLRRELASARMTVEQIAEREGVAKARIYTLLPLTQLGPEPLRAILTGEHSKSMTLKDVLAAAEQLDWEKQAKMLRLPNGRG